MIRQCILHIRVDLTDECGFLQGRELLEKVIAKKADLSYYSELSKVQNLSDDGSD